MPIKIHLSRKLTDLKEQLTEAIKKEQQGNIFKMPQIFVPHTNMKRWLELSIASDQDIAINLDINYLEKGVAALLKTISKDEQQQLPTQKLNFLIIKNLIADGDAWKLTTLEDKINSKKVVQLSEKLGGYFREYQYNRLDMIQAWIKDSKPVTDNSQYDKQQILFKKILSDIQTINTDEDKNYHSLFENIALLKNNLDKIKSDQTLHIFGFNQISQYHYRLLALLSEKMTLNFYFTNFASELSDNFLPQLLQEKELLYRDDAINLSAIRRWKRVGLSNFHFIDKEFNKNNIKADTIGEIVTLNQNENFLQRVQNSIIKEKYDLKPIEPDSSLQFIKAPTMFREIEMVYNTILDNLKNDNDLQLNEIAILTANSESYRPVIEAIFREKGELPVTFADFSADQESQVFRATNSLLELIDGNYKRNELLNFVIQSSLGGDEQINSKQRNQIIKIIDALAIYHDNDNKQQKVPTDYSWSKGLMRLKLGNIMELPDDDTNYDTNKIYNSILPFANIDSNMMGTELLISGLELLLGRIERLKSVSISTEEWLTIFIKIIEDFIKPEKGSEKRAKDNIIREINILNEERKELPQMNSQNTVAILKEIIYNSPQRIKSEVSKPMVGGIIISTVDSVTSLPFKIVYYVGMGEGDFPGRDDRSTLNLQAAEELTGNKTPAGDRTPAEILRYGFMESFLATTQKVYLSFVGKDIVNDRDNNPCSPLYELLDFIEAENIISFENKDSDFPFNWIPYNSFSTGYFNKKNIENSSTNIYTNYNKMDRLLAIEQIISEQKQQTTLSKEIKKEKNNIKKAGKELLNLSNKQQEEGMTIDINISQLKAFLMNPLESHLKYHFSIYDDQSSKENLLDKNDEPFYSIFPLDYNLPIKVIDDYIIGSVAQGEPLGLAELQELAFTNYNRYSLKGETPTAGFATHDLSKLQQKIATNSSGDGTSPFDMAAKLKTLLPGRFIREIIIGDSNGISENPLRLTAPELEVEVNGKLETIHLHGQQQINFINGNRLTTIITTKSKLGVKYLRQASHRLKYYLTPFLFTSSLVLCNRDKTLLAEIKELEVIIQFTDKIHTLIFNFGEEKTKEQLQDQLTTLIKDFLDPKQREQLPFENLMQTIYTGATAKAPGKYSNHFNDEIAGGDSTNDYSGDGELFYKEFSEKIEADNGNWHPAHYYMDSFDLLPESDIQVPKNALEKAIQRLKPFLALANEDNQ